MITIYYESEPQIGINATFDDENGKRCHQYFASMYLFNVWVSSEFFSVETVEITDSNYRQLVEQGKI